MNCEQMVQLKYVVTLKEEYRNYFNKAWTPHGQIQKTHSENSPAKMPIFNTCN